MHLEIPEILDFLVSFYVEYLPIGYIGRTKCTIFQKQKKGQSYRYVEHLHPLRGLKLYHPPLEL